MRGRDGFKRISIFILSVILSEIINVVVWINDQLFKKAEGRGFIGRLSNIDIIIRILFLVDYHHPHPRWQSLFIYLVSVKSLNTTFREKRGAVRPKAMLWPEGIIFYKFAQNLGLYYLNSETTTNVRSIKHVLDDMYVCFVNAFKSTFSTSFPAFWVDIHRRVDWTV